MRALPAKVTAMRAAKIALPTALALALLVLLAAPIGPLPGVFIGGTSAETPERWSDTSDVDEVRLKVPGLVPRVVIVWVVEHGGELHVVGSKDSGWVEGIGAGSPVEMRLGDDTYSLRATPVRDDFQPVLEAYVAKYQADHPDVVAGFPPLDEAPGLVSVFRLERR